MDIVQIAVILKYEIHLLGYFSRPARLAQLIFSVSTCQVITALPDNIEKYTINDYLKVGIIRLLKF